MKPAHVLLAASLAAASLALLPACDAWSGTTSSALDPVTLPGWRDGGLTDALADARSKGTIAFVDVYATWCPPCKRLKKETFPDARVQKALEGVVAVAIDGETEEGHELLKQYQISGFPALLFLDGEGNEVAGRQYGFKSPDELVALLDGARGAAQRK